MTSDNTDPGHAESATERARAPTREPLWFWGLAAVALLLVLFGTARNGGWVVLGAMGLIVGASYGVYRIAVRLGFVWNIKRGMGVVMLPVMAVGALIGSRLGSFEVGVLIGLAAAGVALLLIGLRRPR